MIRKKLITPLAAIVTLIALACPAPVYAAYDLSGHWAEGIINHSISQGYINGYADGSFRPDAPIKRAEFISLANKSMGYAAHGAVNFSDVLPSDWFYDDIGIAFREGYISGMGDGTFRPNDVITRETAAVMAANMLHLSQNTDYASFFTDSGLLTWSRGNIGAAVKAKVLSGYTDGSFRPGKSMTRAEAVSLMNKVAGKKYDTSLDISYGYQDYYSNPTNYDASVTYDDRLNYQGSNISTLTTPDSSGHYRLYNGNYGSDKERENFYSSILYDPKYAGTVKNIYVDGDFELSTFIEKNSELELIDVKITGKLIIYGLGEVTLRNCDISVIECRSTHSGASVTVGGNTTVDETRIYKSVNLTAESLTNGRGFRNIVFDENCRSDVSASFYGSCYSITLDGRKAKLILEKGSAEVVEIASKSEDCEVMIKKNATVRLLDVRSGCYIDGSGRIELAKVTVTGAVFNLKPDRVSGTRDPKYTTTAQAGQQESGQSGYYTVEITVTDGVRALSGVSVQLAGVDTKYTGSDGKAFFAGVANGAYKCVLSLPNVTPANETVRVSGDNVKQTIVYDQTAKFSVTFTVKNGQKFIDGAVVDLDGFPSVTTRADGTAAFTDVEAGTYSYTADYAGVSKTGSVTVKNQNMYPVVDFSK